MKRMARTSSSCYSYGDHGREDRLSSLPDVLLICILSYIDTKLAVQSSVLAKRWVNLWTLLPVLNFDYSLFVEDQDQYTLDKLVYKFKFDSFIDKVLAYRNVSIKLNSVNIKVTDHKIMARVFRYVLLHGVPNFSIDTSENLSRYHPILCDNSSDLLMSLRLKGMLKFGKFLNFVGLVSLRLERVKIVESEPFSCFPNLEKLFLVNCMLSEFDVLEVVGFRLSRLTISSCFHHPNLYKKLVLLTPKLVFLELDGLIPMPFEAFGIPLLDIVYMDCYSNDQINNHEHKLNLINIFRCLRNAKRVHLSPSTIQLLNICHGMLDDEPCPFGNLEYLNLIPPPNKPAIQLLESVTSFLLKDCPQAVVEAIHW